MQMLRDQILRSRAELGGWMPFFEEQLAGENFAKIDAAYSADCGEHEVYPPLEQVFRAFALTPPEAARCVLIGQDPYHTPGQAQGLAFSVPDGSRAQPSLTNIKREIASDLGPGVATPGTDLAPWAWQGVFLLNSVLTVRRGEPASHGKVGWQAFTRDALRWLFTTQQGPLAAILWGKYAQKVWDDAVLAAKACAAAEREMSAAPAGAPGRPLLVLRSAHPSPYSANNGFFGSRPFSQVNAFLQAHGEAPIDWSIPKG